MFDYYMMDEFMSFMDAESWYRDAYEDASQIKNVEARWIPQDAFMEISHAIRRDGALTCNNCHSKNGVLDFKALGYDAEETELLQENPL